MIIDLDALNRNMSHQKLALMVLREKGEIDRILYNKQIDHINAIIQFNDRIKNRDGNPRIEI